MKIWIDADSCPPRIREIICKAGNRLKIYCIFVANRIIPIKKNAYTKSVQTDNVEQSADRHITENAVTGDLVVTRDIPLAKTLVDAGIVVINDRGDLFTANNINTKLSARNFMYELNMAGLKPESINKFGKKEIQKFAATLDKELSKLVKA